MNTAIICEFNPFHKGHKHLINTIKSENNGIICIMSGNFVQRGEFAIYDKFKRAEVALKNGADLVIELPCIYSLKSAQGFAESGVRIAQATGVVDELAFGAECDDINKLEALAKCIDEKQAEISLEIKKGISYPAAIRNVTGSDLLDFPNNTLAIEYLRATSLPCKVVKRIGKGYNSDDTMYSASAIRKTLDNNEICTLKNCEIAVLSKLRTMITDDFREIEDVSEGLENRIIEAVKTATTLEELYDTIKTKRYTHSRIRRIILRAYLGINKNYCFDVPYIRILGFNEKGREILKNMKKTAQLPVVSRFGDIKDLDENCKRLFELECKCTDLYNLGYTVPKPCETEKTNKIIIL